MSKNNRGLGNYDRISSSIGLPFTLLSSRDPQTQVTDLVDVNRESLSEGCCDCVFLYDFAPVASPLILTVFTKLLNVSLSPHIF